MILLSKEQADQLKRRFGLLYGEENAPRLMERFHMMLGRYGVGENTTAEADRWSERDTILITYADSIVRDGEAPLETLRQFLECHAGTAIRCVRLLPFCPSSSDDGFSVIDYRRVDTRHGNWADVVRLGREFDLMFDLVLNHCSRRSSWFRDFVTGVEPARSYFLPTDPDTDLSAVDRPGGRSLLTKVSTRHGDEWVWTTFGSDQIDLNWRNPNLLFEFLDIVFLYLSEGARVLQLDAVAFLWKEMGTDCLHRPETHEVVKLFRDVLDIVSPRTLLATDPSVPQGENLHYFGEGDEAHLVYNVSLPPLLLHGLLRGDCSLVRDWSESLAELPEAQTFLHYTASQDGIDVRPLRGRVGEEEIDWLIRQVQDRGGRVTYRTGPEGTESPYEVNISYVDALAMPGEEELGVRRFLCSQVIMLSLPGVPAIYLQSLLGASNDIEGFEALGHNRALNRKKWNIEQLEMILADETSLQSMVFGKLLAFLRRRGHHAVFHPAAGIEFLDLGSEILAFRRIEEGGEDLLCLFNFSDRGHALQISDLYRPFSGLKVIRDVLNEETIELTGDPVFHLEPYGAHWLSFV